MITSRKLIFYDWGFDNNWYLELWFICYCYFVKYWIVYFLVDVWEDSDLESSHLCQKDNFRYDRKDKVVSFLYAHFGV